MPNTLGAPAGGYVAIELEDLLGLVALESHRHRCLVDGEDLGTVADEFRRRLGEWSVLSYRVLYFEKHWGGGGDQTFRSPTEYPTLALVTVGTHDLPTFGGYCLARNIDVRARLGVFPDAHGEASQRRHRVADLDRLAQALNEEGLRFSQQTDGETGMPADEFATAAHAFLARSPAKLMAVQIEDLLGETDQANVPGTDREHPNWRRKLPIKISEWESREPLNAIVNAVVEERGKTQR